MNSFKNLRSSVKSVFWYCCKNSLSLKMSKEALNRATQPKSLANMLLETRSSHSRYHVSQCMRITGFPTYLVLSLRRNLSFVWYIWAKHQTKRVVPFQRQPNHKVVDHYTLQLYTNITEHSCWVEAQFRFNLLRPISILDLETCFSKSNSKFEIFLRL